MKISAAIILNPKDKKVLIIERKVPDGKLSWQFPAGKIELNESSQHAAERELLEETNILCHIDKFIASRIHPNTNVKIDYSFGHFVKGEIKANRNEVKQVKWATIKEITQLFNTDIYSPVFKLLEENTKIE
jgi:8-oxo-dGTP diphosphatase